MILEFNLQSQEILYLSSADIRLSKLIRRIGNYTLELNKNYYLKLIKSVVGQQLSIKAKEIIWSRIEDLCPDITPKNILAVNDNMLRAKGLSYPKISYIKELSEKIFTNEINLESLTSLNNDEVINLLTGIKGIGKWTTEMFLIFSLGRLDVMSLGDAGLRRAIKWLYNLDNTPNPSEIADISEPWKPFRSVASLYLWEAINTDLILQKSNIVF